MGAPRRKQGAHLRPDRHRVAGAFTTRNGNRRLIRQPGTRCAIRKQSKKRQGSRRPAVPTSHLRISLAFLFALQFPCLCSSISYAPSSSFDAVHLPGTTPSDRARAPWPRGASAPY